MFSVTETAALTGLEERAVRKEVESDVIHAGSPPQFDEEAIVYLRATAALPLSLDARRRLYGEIRAAMTGHVAELQFGPWSLALGSLAAEVHALAEAFVAWRDARIETRMDVLAGEPAFRGTRLAVRHVGGMMEHGAPVEEILEDYPYIDANDIAFARLYTVAYPKIGRPRAQAPAG